MKKILLSFLILAIGNTFVSTDVNASGFFEGIKEEWLKISPKSCPSGPAKAACAPICKEISKMLNERLRSDIKLYTFKEARIMYVANKIKEHLLKKEPDRTLQVAKLCENCCGNLADSKRVIQIVISMLECEENPKCKRKLSN